LLEDHIRNLQAQYKIMDEYQTRQFFEEAYNSTPSGGSLFFTIPNVKAIYPVNWEKDKNGNWTPHEIIGADLITKNK